MATARHAARRPRGPCSDGSVRPADVRLNAFTCRLFSARRGVCLSLAPRNRPVGEEDVLMVVREAGEESRTPPTGGWRGTGVRRRDGRMEGEGEGGWVGGGEGGMDGWREREEERDGLMDWWMMEG